MPRLKGRIVAPIFRVLRLPRQDGGLPAFILERGCRLSRSALGIVGLTASGRLFVFALGFAVIEITLSSGARSGRPATLFNDGKVSG